MNGTTAPGPLASLARRSGSLVYEALLLAAVLFLCTWVFLFFAQSLDRAIARPLLQLWLLFLTGVYFCYCWSRGGQTLPMKTWRIRVESMSGAPLTPRQAVLRFIYALLTYPLLGLTIAWSLYDKDRQFLHDRLAGTRLVNTT